MAQGLGLGAQNSLYFWTGNLGNAAGSGDTTLNTFTLGAASFTKEPTSL